MLPIQGFDDEHYIVMATNRGTIKKTPLSAFRNARLKGIIATTLEEGEMLVGVAVSDGGEDIMLFSDAGKCVRFSESALRPMGRQAHGVRGMRLDEGQSVISLIVTRDEEKFVLAATEHGYGKRTPVGEYPRKSRGIRGVIAISTKTRNGRMVSAVLTDPDDEIMMLTTGGKVVRTSAGDVSVVNRAAMGVRLINPGDDTLASVRRVEVKSSDDELEKLNIEVSDEDLQVDEDPVDDESEVLESEADAGDDLDGDDQDQK